LDVSSWVAAIVDTRGRSDFWDVARRHHVGLLMQTSADVHGVRAFDRGKLVRRIDYSGDSGWLDVSGTPQPWESVFFFDGPADLAPGTTWPDTIWDDLEDADIARYEAARAIGAASDVMDLVHASGGGIHRVAAALGVDPSHPSGRYRRPRWWQRLLGR
jgi:hypothetical protein